VKRASEKSWKVNQQLTNLSQQLATRRARATTAKQASEKKESQSSTGSGDGKCVRCKCARAVVSTDNVGRDLGGPTYCQRCSEMLVARANKDWRLCR
jgi:hypothetical protein